MNPRAPLVIVVGFLGAGKTTFLREILPNLEERGLEPLVIINDYSNARVDAATLQKEGRPVIPIHGNCICCDSLFELIRVLEDIELTENRLVLIEANGTTDPAVLIEHLLVKQELKSRFAPLIQVTIVDGQRWQLRDDHNELEHLQLETASHIQLTRMDMVSDERAAEVQSSMQCSNPAARTIEPASFAAELAEMMRPDHVLPVPALPDQRPMEEVYATAHHSHGPHHDHDRHHPAHAFVGLEMKLPDPMPTQHLRDWLAALPDNVLRIKGLIRFSEEPARWFHFQTVDGTLNTFKQRELRQQPKLPACAVLIGVRLDESAIRASLITTRPQEVTDAA
ncbi:MAG: GTP-binding protein [Verrucomicrobiota bacterium]